MYLRLKGYDRDLPLVILLLALRLARHIPGTKNKHRSSTVTGRFLFSLFISIVFFETRRWKTNKEYSSCVPRPFLGSSPG
jgi:hypothetical protein